MPNPTGLPDPVRAVPHGTTNGYGRHRCRCELCRAANAAAARAYAAKRRAQGRPIRRREQFSVALVCEHCGSGFRGPKRNQRFCSHSCHMRHAHGWSTCTDLVPATPTQRPVAPPVPVTVVKLPKWWGVIVSGPCAWCSEQFTCLSATARYCSRRCVRSAERSRGGERFSVRPRFRYAIYQRDGWLCQLCLEPVERDAGLGSDWRATLDHIVPRSKGGSDEWENLRLVHAWCNAVRGAEDYHSDLFGGV